jgi:hypothetical protein
MFEQTHKCDACGITKQQSNHWYLVWLGAPDGQIEFSVRPWEKFTAETDDDALAACGQSCAHKLMDKFFTETVTTLSVLPGVSPNDPVSRAMVDEYLASVEERPTPQTTYGVLYPSSGMPHRPDTSARASRPHSLLPEDQLLADDTLSRLLYDDEDLRNLSDRDSTDD